MQGINYDKEKGTCQRGFFVIRTCQKPAVGLCALSKRYICEDCAIELDGQLVSREEYYKKRKADNEEDLASSYDYTHDSLDYGLWYYYFRDDFYNQGDYVPFDNYDAQAFEGHAPASPEDWEDADSSGSFYDS